MRRSLLLALLACSSRSKPEPAPATKPEAVEPPAAKQLVLPGGAGGIGFDDLLFSPSLHRVLAPGGRTGKLDLIDPATLAIESIDGFSSSEQFEGGHGEGTTSVDEGAGYLFATDRGRSEVAIIAANKIVGVAKLAGHPDYVRWVKPGKEVWVTEPDKQQIERFVLDGAKLVRKGVIGVAGGPESLAIDVTRGRAYTHTWEDETVVIDIARREEIARWKNGCNASRGIALDEQRGFLFVGCEEGKASAIDVAHDGKPLGAVPAGKGVDIIAYSPSLAHLYVPGGDDATLSIIGVDATGKLAVLATLAVPDDAHCVTADDAGHAYVCDPRHGSLRVVSDVFK